MLLVPLAALFVELLKNDRFAWDAWSLTAVYLMWISLCCAGFLCIMSRYFGAWLSKAGHSVYWMTLALVCFIIFVLVELVIQLYFYHHFDSARFMRLSLIAFIVVVVLFRLFSLLGVLKQRAQAETSSRLQSLQSRIEPHFLFNSLNTIAELAHVNSQHAEDAIQSLSSLIRNSLNDNVAMHSLADEIVLCQQYARLEQWRLGERLTISWDIKVPPLDQQKIKLPKLLLQPLIENAVVHGVAPAEQGGTITIHVSQQKKKLKIELENSLVPHLSQSTNETKEGGSPSAGLGMALPNIKERLFVLYDDQHRFITRNQHDHFHVLIELPIEHESHDNLHKGIVE